MRNLIVKIFDGKATNVTVVPGCQKQYDTDDCGLFAIATATSLLESHSKKIIPFQQSKMRSHLLVCFENLLMTPFPQATV